ncbi:hypothetical protein [Streptomyces daliensis]|uniref:Uncharacterized protein n=1 Tax=Streptomyces daliensis TaxID=299421 RepID=A0A8T4IYS8_9ACTN|nr:hypothetical protein [Streptomyces daliensis]
MIDFITTTKMTDRSVVASCLLGSRFSGTGVSGVALGGSERPAKAPAVAANAAAQAQAHAYASALAANGAGEGRQKTQRMMTWAFRGLEPWRDPA